MNLLCEAMSQLRIEKYLTAVDIQKSINISNLKANDENTIIKVDEMESVLLQSRKWVTRARESFDKFVEKSSKESEQFKYWPIFVDELELVIGCYIYRPLKELSNYFLRLIEQIIPVRHLFIFRTV